MDVTTSYADQKFLVTKVYGLDAKTFKAYGYEIISYPPSVLSDPESLKIVCEDESDPISLGVVHINNVVKDEETGYYTVPCVSMFDEDDLCLIIDPTLNKRLGLK